MITENEKGFTKNFLLGVKQKLKFKKQIIFLVLAGLLLVFGGASAGYFLYTVVNPVNEAPIPIKPEDTASQPSKSEPQPKEESVENKKEGKTVKKVLGSVSWREPKKIEPLDMFVVENYPNGGTYTRNDNVEYFLIGSVTDGDYKGAEVILIEADANSPSRFKDYIHLIKTADNRKIILLDGEDYNNEKNSEDYNLEQVEINKDLKLPDLDFPETISGPSSRQQLKLDKWAIVMFNDDYLKKSFLLNDLGWVYTTRDGFHSDAKAGLFGKDGFYIRAADGTARAYYLVVDFMDEDEVPAIIWSDGSTINKESYRISDSGSCGSLNYASVLTTVSINNDLQIIGESEKGDKIYGLKDSEHPLLSRLGIDKIATYKPGDEEMTEVNILDYRPIIFFKDPFDRLVKLDIAKFTPAGECGKPVIYLYPEKETEVFVQVEPQGGLTYSEPDYGRGWRVLAKPDGELTEIKSGLKYPYLFWEGRGGLYETPSKGFVVERNEVHSFLIEKLAKLGLNNKETNDFLEFWEPKMQSAPYYFITFLGNQEMNRLAPLEIKPKPDTIIRILMDFSPLDKPIAVQGFDIKTPKRKGFTVVEWGGVIK